MSEFFFVITQGAMFCPNHHCQYVQLKVSCSNELMGYCSAPLKFGVMRHCENCWNLADALIQLHYYLKNNKINSNSFVDWKVFIILLTVNLQVSIAVHQKFLWPYIIGCSWGMKLSFLTLLDFMKWLYRM